MTSFRPLLLPSLLLLGLGACATPYQRPDVAAPAQFAHGTAAANAPKVSETWWQSFGDPKLNSLVDTVLATNNDLAASAIRVLNRSRPLASDSVKRSGRPGSKNGVRPADNAAIFSPSRSMPTTPCPSAAIAAL